MRVSFLGRRLAAILTILASANLAVGQVFDAPSSGWAYTFEGADAADSVDPFGSLDGTWDHNNGSDQWDGTGIGEGNPGGASALMDGSTTFLRIQDPGDPRDHGFDDPGSNRKVYFTHNLIDDLDSDPGNLNSIVDDGVTLYFRTRVATAATGPIDDLHADGGSATEPWPSEGRGYFQHDSGKSLIAIKQTDGANVALGLNYAEATFADDLFVGDSNQQGLILQNLLFGDTLAGEGGDFGLTDSNQDSDPDNFNIDYNANQEGQILEVDDITSWQEFWVTIEAGSTPDPDFPDELNGSHKVTIYNGGAADPTVANEFYISAASGSDYVDSVEESYIAIGAGATPQAGAFDIDFLSWAPGVHVPTVGVGPTCDPNSMGDLDGNGMVEFADFLVLSANFGAAADSHEQGDIDCNGMVEFADFLALSANFGQSVGAAQSVPEPSSALLVLSGALLMLARRKHRG